MNGEDREPISRGCSPSSGTVEALMQTPVHVRVLMNGVTGRMGTNQHLLRSVVPLRDEGGVELADGRRVVPEPVLIGRNEDRLQRLADASGVDRWTTDLDAALEEPGPAVYFDAQLTALRPAGVRRAIEAGKHVYTEKPVAPDLETTVELARLADNAGVRHGAVQDKLYLPGIRKLSRLVRSGFFGRLLSARCEFGYWVFEGDWQPAQRPSWNYQAERGGGIVSDMFPHWSYVFEHLIGPLASVWCTVATHIPDRFDEQGEHYRATAEDAAYAVIESADGVIAQVNSSWCVRVHRDELLELQLDGTHGSAVAGLHECIAQHRAHTPRPVWNPDVPGTDSFRDDWSVVPPNAQFENAFKTQWRQFLRHIFDETEFPDFFEAAKGVQLADAATQSARENRRIPLPNSGNDTHSPAGDSPAEAE